MIRRRWFTICVVGFLGCGRGEVPKQVMVDERDPTANEVSKLVKEIENMKPVDSVAVQKLIDLLPRSPSGFMAEKPSGEYSTVAQHNCAFAKCRYQENEKSLEVKILDAARIGDLYMGIVTTNKRETSEGYEKGVAIDGNLGIEKYDKQAKRGHLSVIVGKRFIVTIDAQGVPDDFVRTVYRTIDVKNLAQLLY
jgi:hypothetical protein